MSVVTKRALAQSLKALMKKMTLDQVTVKDVVSDCGVNRQTFYYHFKDIYDLIEWIYEIEALESIEKYKSYNNWQQGFYKIFEYVGNNKEFCIHCFNSIAREPLDRYLYNSTYNLLLGVVREVSSGAVTKDKNLSFIANFYTYAFIGIMTHW